MARIAVPCLIVALSWGSCAVWNSVKPMPPGTRVASLPARLAESQVDFLGNPAPSTLLERETEAIARAEQTIVLDQSPVPRQVAEALLLRRRQRPHLKVMLVTDPRDEADGGTPSRVLGDLERAGVVVVRVRLERMRDSNPLYSSVWRLCVGWWSDPFDEEPAAATLLSTLRRLNAKSDRRQLVVADDGAGAWTSLVMSPAAAGSQASDGVALDVRGPLARAMAVSELQIAAWSADDDRLPAAPPVDAHGMGTIDARFLTEGAISAALREAIRNTAAGDSIKIAVRAFGDRQLQDAILRAASRGVRVQVLLGEWSPASQAAAGELRREATGTIEVRWLRGGGGYSLIEHGGDVWLHVSSADFTRRSLDDLDLAAGLELRMPARAGPARAAALLFAKRWSGAAAYAAHADESPGTYWRYRIGEATGLPVF